MELFELFGTIVIENKKANKNLDEITKKASQSSDKITEAFEKVGIVVKESLDDEEFDNFNDALDDTVDETNKSRILITKAFEKIGTSIKRNLDDDELNDFEHSIDDVADEANDAKSKITKSFEKIGDAVKKNCETDSLDDFKDSMKDAAEEAEGMGGQIGSAFSKLKGTISNYGGKISGIVTGAFAIDKIAQFGQACITTSEKMQGASNNFAALTGTMGEDLSEYEDAIERIYSQNYGESLEDVSASMATVKQQMRDLDAEGLEQITTSAIILRDTFDYEVGESVRAAKMLMDQFGISSEEAFNLIAQGSQQGLDKNNDLLDSINEYSVQYQQLGYDAEEFFNSLLNGAEGGAFSIDKVGDAMKEFGIRAKDGSDTSATAFETLGLDAEKMFLAFNTGGPAAEGAMDAVTSELFAMNDQVKQNEVGLALFGPMWEDLGVDAIEALTDVEGEIDKTKNTLEEINEVKYDTLGAKFSELGRTFEMNIAKPIGDEVTPIIEEGVTSLNDYLKVIGDPSAENIAAAFGDTAKDIVVGIDAIENTWNKFCEGAEKRFNDTTTNVANNMAGLVKKLAGQIGGLSKNLADQMAGLMGMVPANEIANVQSGASGAGQGIGQILSGNKAKSSQGGSTGSRTEKYANGAVLTKATAFGYNPYTGKTMIAGEAGAEAIAPIDTLQAYIMEAVNHAQPQQDIGEQIASALSNIGVEVNVDVKQDDRGVFRVVQQQARIYKKSTGQGAFA